MKLNKEGRNLDLDLGPASFGGVHWDGTTRGVFWLWLSETQFPNIFVATSLELRLGWPPVRCLRGWLPGERR